MKIKSMLSIYLDERETEEAKKTQQLLYALSETIVNDSEGRAPFSANTLKTAADIVGNILKGEELY